MQLFTVSDRPLDVAVLVLPESSMMSLASALEPMRAANRIANRQLFRWQLSTIDDQPARLTCGLTISPEIQLSELPGGDLLLLIAGFNQERHAGRRQLKQIRLLTRRFELVCGIESASWILARCGLLDARKATTHWEDLDEFMFRFPAVRVKPDRFVIDGAVATTGGASPTFDFMLRLIQSRYGYPLALDVSSVFIYSAEQRGTDIQSQVSLGILQDNEPRVAAAIRLMQDHIDEPRSIDEISNAAGISSRMLELLFSKTLKSTPSAYYRHLRLQTARRLVVDTRLSIQEIAIRAGYNSLPAFSRAFKTQYGFSPMSLRLQLDDGGIPAS